ncbi:winged helix-turn-helix domain-containing protein [Vibrio genomosp. F10]|uniref:winged helix-turn-helix domain-containing protein n=1 Tax=Vibrio genomosp. F10 TaxID=723171 RepID=UPI0002F7BAF5|nr:winged helix-turn-helix domain-containing protein [Vibrio genomosp. F10]OEF07315.1 hypothetical protein A1QI_17785 [Vibrio genomosp. F10 str. 9ZB36]
MTQSFLEPPIYKVAGFLYSPTSGSIKNGQGKIIRLRAREANLLTALIDAFPDILSRQTIEEKLWKGSYATNATINQTIKALRFSLDDDQRSLIRTIPKQGYALSSKPHLIEEETSPALQPASTDRVAPSIDQQSEVNKTLFKAPSLFTINQWFGLITVSLSLFLIAYQVGFYLGFERISHKVGEHWVLFEPSADEIESLKLSDEQPSIVVKTFEGYRICHENKGVTLCKNQ